MDIKCPHCGTEYEVEKKDMYRYTKCEVCGKGFVIGATTSLLSESSAAQPSSGNQSMARGAKPQPHRSAVPRSRPFANINKTPASPNVRQSKRRSTNAVMWLSIGGVCLVLVIALAVVFATRGNRHGKATAIASSEVGTHAEKVVQNDGSAPTASDVVAEEKKEDYISKLIKEAKAGSVLSEVSQCELGDCYSEGKGVEVNHAEAVKWYRMSAERGFAIAQENLGVKYANGRGVEKDESEAVKWYRKAAEQGRPSSQYLLGCCYDQGKGVEKDEKEAAKWYRKAAEQGFSYAQYCLGVCYEIGDGVEKNEEEAVKWYRKAAEQGHADAQFSLGDCYYNGEGVDEDLVEAAKWYRKASEQGNADAQYGLANCYYEGEGVEYNPTEALNLLRKAAAQGHDEAQKSLKDAIERQNKYKSDDELVKAFQTYRKNDNSGLSLDVEIEKFLVNEGGWDERHCRDVIRNSLRKGRRLEDMPEDELKEYMEGSEYGKVSTGVKAGTDVIDETASSDGGSETTKVETEEPNEAQSAQEAEIARRKAATASNTLQSFCGIKFGLSRVKSGGGGPIVIGGETYIMNVNNVECNQFRSFGKHGYARVYKSSAGRVFAIRLKNEGNEPICVEEGGGLSKEAQRVVSVLSSKYGKPYVLEEESRYHIIENRRHHSDRLRVFLFPVGYSSVILYLGYGDKSGLYCVNDIEAKRAIDDLHRTKRENAVEGYKEFASGDFLGLKFGELSPYYRKGKNSFGMPKGMVDASPEYSVHTGLGVNFECRRMTMMKVGVTCTSHKVAMISARFDPLESIDEEFNSLCTMCEKKLGMRRQIDVGHRLATITDGDIVVTIKKGPSILFRAESKKMLRLATEEGSVVRERNDAAREASLPGVESLDGPLRPRR